MKLRLTLILILAHSLIVGACATDPSSGDAGGRPQVVAGFFPLAEAAREVGGDRVEITDLTPAGAEPHDLELSPDQVDAVLDADVVLYFGGGFQPSLEEVVATRGGASVDVLLQVLGPDAYDRGAVDPHIWLDPVLFSSAAAEIQAALAVADPDGATAYEEAARDFQDRLAGLDAAYSSTLRSCERDLIVTSHDAFGRLAERYGLRVEPIAGIAPEAEPDPDRLAELADLVELEGVTTIFTETLVSPEVAEVLAREAGVTTAVLDPLEGLSAEDAEAGATYLSVMRDNLATLAGALGCTPP